ncbi:hypothetical protein ABLO07_01045 [Mycobacterium tuberculosis]
MRLADQALALGGGGGSQLWWRFAGPLLDGSEIGGVGVRRAASGLVMRNRLASAQHSVPPSSSSLAWCQVVDQRVPDRRYGTKHSDAFRRP